MNPILGPKVKKDIGWETLGPIRGRVTSGRRTGQIIPITLDERHTIITTITVRGLTQRPKE